MWRGRRATGWLVGVGCGLCLEPCPGSLRQELSSLAAQGSCFFQGSRRRPPLPCTCQKVPHRPSIHRCHLRPTRPICFHRGRLDQIPYTLIHLLSPRPQQHRFILPSSSRSAFGPGLLQFAWSQLAHRYVSPWRHPVSNSDHHYIPRFVAHGKLLLHQSLPPSMSDTKSRYLIHLIHCCAARLPVS